MAGAGWGGSSVTEWRQEQQQVWCGDGGGSTSAGLPLYVPGSKKARAIGRSACRQQQLGDAHGDSISGGQHNHHNNT